MRITVITLTKNEERIMPYFLRHCVQHIQADEIVVYDNDSTDKTREIVRACPVARVVPFSTGGQTRDSEHMEIKNLAYRNAGKYAPQPPVTGEWFVIVDSDEFVWADGGLRPYLEDCERQGYTLPHLDGYQMMPGALPPPDDGKLLLTDWCKAGTWFWLECKRAVVHAGIEVNYSPGCHSAHPVGACLRDAQQRIKLLHWKCFTYEDTMEQYAEDARTISRENVLSGLGIHVLHTEGFRAQYDQWMQGRKQVIP